MKKCIGSSEIEFDGSEQIFEEFKPATTILLEFGFKEILESMLHRSKAAWKLLHYLSHYDEGGNVIFSQATSKYKVRYRLLLLEDAIERDPTYIEMFVDENGLGSLISGFRDFVSDGFIRILMNFDVYHYLPFWASWCRSC
jgi:hypothetical protein